MTAARNGSEMPNLFGVAKQSNVNVTSDGSDIGQRFTRDGSEIAQAWIMSMVANGRVFNANFGSLATPLASASAAVTNLRPQAWLRVPSATAIIPVRADFNVAALAGTANDFLIAYAQNDVGNGTSTAGSVGPISLRTDAPVASTVTVRQLATGDVTAPTNPTELIHRNYKYAGSADATGNSGTDIGVRWPYGPSDALPILVGPASFMVYIGGTTTGPTFFGSIQWVEVPSNWFT